MTITANTGTAAHRKPTSHPTSNRPHNLPTQHHTLNPTLHAANPGTFPPPPLSSENAPVRLLAHEHICLAVPHPTGEISPEPRAHLGRAPLELARQYATPAAA